MKIRAIAQIFPDYVPRKQGFLEEYVQIFSRQARQNGVTPFCIVSAAPEPAVRQMLADAGAVIELFPDVFPAYRRCGCRRLISWLQAHQVDVVDFHFGDDLTVWQVSAMLRRQMPRLIQVRHQHNVYGLGTSFPWLRKFFSRLRLSCRAFDRLIAVSGAVAEDLRQHSIAPEKICRIYNGINLARYQRDAGAAAAVRREFNLAPERRIIIAVAYACPMKGLEYLIDAMPILRREIADARLFIVGGGPLTGQLHAQAQARGVADVVFFLGVRNDVPALLSAADVCVLPSVSSEGLPTALLESLACRTPVVATDLAQCREIIESEQTGLLVPVRDPERLARALSRMVMDPALAGRLAEAGYLMVHERFTQERMMRETCALYEQLFFRRNSVRV